jgi:hypothetical protein
MLGSAAGTILLYFTSIIFLREYINVDVITADFLVTIMMIVSVSWLPLHIVKCIMKYVDPSDYQKVMQKIWYACDYLYINHSWIRNKLLFNLEENNVSPHLL